MRKILYCILAFILMGAAPSRTTTYTSGTTIRAADVTSNEDAIFNYLRSGIDTISDGSIVNADVNSAAAIDSTKLNLAAINQNITFSGSNTFAGTTIANLGTVTTGIFTWVDINGGTLDGVQIGTETATGMLLVNNASDVADGLGSQGTSGQVLTSAGSGANPTWGAAVSAEIFTSDGTFTAPAGITKVYITMCGGGGGGAGGKDSGNAGGGGGGGECVVNYPYTVVASSSYSVDVGAKGSGGAAGSGDGTAGANSTFDSTGVVASGGAQGITNAGGGGAGGGLTLDASGTTAGGSNGVVGGAGANGSSGNGGGGGGTYFGTGGAGGSGAAAGSNATGYGSGGGGGGVSGGGGYAGGNGSDGFCIVMY